MWVCICSNNCIYKVNNTVYGIGISYPFRSTEINIRELRKSFNIKPYIKRIDTVAAEWPAQTNYFYSTYNADEHDTCTSGETSGSENAVMVLGSGVYRIGSSVEFDCCSVGCITELRKVNFENYLIFTFKCLYKICVIVKNVHYMYNIA